MKSFQNDFWRGRSQIAFIPYPFFINISFIETHIIHPHTLSLSLSISHTHTHDLSREQQHAETPLPLIKIRINWFSRQKNIIFINLQQSFKS